MTALEAVILGLVEGFTEYLPVSSTGHLLVVEHLLGMEGTAATSYAIVIQAGAILAVLGAYGDRWRTILTGGAAGRQLFVRLMVAFVPAGMIGFLFDDVVESMLGGLWPVVVAWAIGAVAILVLDGRHGDDQVDTMSNRQALVIGLAQCLALWPGTSRSLATILAGQLTGLGKAASVEFSFLLGFVTLGAATTWSGVKHGDELLAAYGLQPILIGLVVSWASASLAVRGLVAWLDGHGLRIFAVWRLLIALAVTIGLLTTEC